jgi:hypothetical protein
MLTSDPTGNKQAIPVKQQKINKSEIKDDAAQLAELLYRIFKQSYPKIKVGVNKNAE